MSILEFGIYNNSSNNTSATFMINEVNISYFMGNNMYSSNNQYFDCSNLLFGQHMIPSFNTTILT
jgi:hypothetical protein